MKRVLAILLCTLLLFGMSACNKKEAAPEKTLGLGEEYLDDGDYEKALEQFLKYIALEPKEEYGYICAANAYFNTSKTDEAIDILEKGLDKTGSDRISEILDGVNAAAEMVAAASGTKVESAKNESDTAIPERSLNPGEILLTGTADYKQADSFTVSFIMSENRQEIRDVKVEIVNLNVSARSGNTQMNINSGSVTTTYMGAHKVADGKIDAAFGDGSRLSLSIDGNIAEGTIDYIYTVSTMSVLGAPSEKIPVELGTQPIKFVSDTPLEANDTTTLTVSAVNFAGMSEIGSIDFTDESGAPVSMPTDWNEWFENAAVDTVQLTGTIKMQINNSGSYDYSLGEGSKLRFNFVVDGKNYPIGVCEGAQFAVEKTAGGYILLPEETAEMSPPPVGESTANEDTPDNNPIDEWFENVSWNGSAVKLTARKEATVAGISVFAGGLEYLGDIISNSSGDMGLPNGTTAWPGSQLSLMRNNVIIFAGTSASCEVKGVDAEPEQICIYLESGETLTKDL